MNLKQRKGLKGPLADRNKGSTSKEVPKTQVPANLPLLPPSPPPSTDLGLLAIPNLKKKRLVHNLKEGELVPQKGSKQQRTTKDPGDKKASSVENRDEAEVHRQQSIWAPRLKLEGAAIPWDASIWESQRGHATYLAKALEQPLLLLKDMEALRHTRQPDLFMSLKRDLTMVSIRLSLRIRS